MKLGGFSWRDQRPAYPGLLTNTTLTWELADSTAKIPVRNSSPLERIIVTAARMMESNLTPRNNQGMRINCKSVTNGVILFRIMISLHITNWFSISIGSPWLGLWSSELPDATCENSISYYTNLSQPDCQELCEKQSGCIGISYSQTGKSCYLCNDSIVREDGNGYGFHRNPGNTTWSYLSEMKCHGTIKISISTCT